MGQRLKKAKKLILIGLDAPIAKRVYAYAQAGELPAIQGLIEQGVRARHCLGFYPTSTPPNWTTIATGCSPGTHGITGFNVHVPGEDLSKTTPAFDSRLCRAEYLWTTAERVGKVSIVFNYPCSWPPTLEKGIVVFGAGTGVNWWVTAHPDDGIDRPGYTLANSQLFATEVYPLANSIELKPATGWSNVSIAEGDLEADLDLVFRQAVFSIEDKQWHMLLRASAGRDFDRVILSESKDGDDAFADLRVGEWSPVVFQQFETATGSREGAFRCKLLELSSDGRQIRLYVTVIDATEGYTYPQSVAVELKSAEALPSARDGYYPFLFGWIDLHTLRETIEFQHVWFAEAVEHLLTTKEWDIFFTQVHAPDWMYHTFSTKLEPATASDDHEVAEYQAIELAVYQSLDRLIGRMLACGDENTLVVLTSDHGAKATTRDVQVGNILVQAGLTTLKDVPTGPDGRPTVEIKGAFKSPYAQHEIDWTRTVAYAQRPGHIYINVKGRDPRGIVEPGVEYESACDRVLAALYDYTDPEANLKPVSLALKRRDARIRGLYGEGVGDIVYAVHPEFGHEHGHQLTTSDFGIGSLEPMFVMKGPGVKHGVVLERTVSLADIVPTVCHLMELPVPPTTEGAIIYQALENPNGQLEELQTVRRNYARLERAFQSGQAETHTY